MADANQVVPNYGKQPNGRAKIMKQGQTEVDAWGADPVAKGQIPEVRENPPLGG
jgi:hypothetical protein